MEALCGVREGLSGQKKQHVQRPKGGTEPVMMEAMGAGPHGTSWALGKMCEKWDLSLISQPHGCPGLGH